MSKCDLTIVLDRENRRYAGGDRITGVLRVQVNAACTCKALSISLGWRTHGKGNRDTGTPADLVLFEGEWQPGKTHEYDFEFLVPDGPATYHGRVLNLDWYLNARADIPWAIDPKAEEEVLLVPGPEPWIAPLADHSALPEVTRQIMKSNVGGKPLGCLLAFTAPILFGGLSLLYMGISGLVSDPGAGKGGALGWGEPILAILFGLVLTSVPVLVLFRVAGNRIAAHRLGTVEVDVAPRSLRPGESVTCRLRFHPTAEVRVNGIEAELRGTEVAVSGSGTNETRHSHPLAGQVAPLSGPRSFPPGKVVELEHAFTVPADATHSFHAPSNSIQWSLNVRIHSRFWPTWRESVVVVVHG